MPKCIYCKKIKEKGEFNREHVVPMMMGRYDNALVLSDCQVCEECNSFFSREIEDKIAMDSYEAYLRMRFRSKQMRDGHRILDNRIKFKGVKGILNGLTLYAVSDSKIPERMHFEIAPCVGIQRTEYEYDYYTLDEIPYATEKKMQDLRKHKSPIIQFGYNPNDAAKVLKERGYITDNASYSEKGLIEEYGEKEVITKIKILIDTHVLRLCAKTIFNFICWHKSEMNMFDPKFNAIREFVRYGVWDDSLWIRCSEGFVSSVQPPNDTAHAVGTMIYCNVQSNMWELLGCVTWFGDITYIIKICDLCPIKETDIGGGLKAIVGPDYDTKFMFFDNDSGKISTDNSKILFAK